MRKTVTLTDISREFTIVADVFGTNVNQQEAIDFISGVVEDRLSLDSPYDPEHYIYTNWNLTDFELRSLDRTIKQLRAKAVKHLNKTPDSGYALFKVLASHDAQGIFSIAIATVGDRRIEEWNAWQEEKRIAAEEAMQESEVYSPALAIDKQEHDRQLIREGRYLRNIREIANHNHFEKCVRKARNFSDYTHAYQPAMTDKQLVASSRALDVESSKLRQELLDTFNANRIKLGLSPILNFEDDSLPEDNMHMRAGFDHVKAALEGSRSH